MKNTSKMMLAVALSMPLVFSPTPSVADGVKQDGGSVRYELWTLAADCSVIESTIRGVGGQDGGEAFIQILPSGNVYFKFRYVDIDKTSRAINISGKTDFSARTVKTPWGFYTTPVTHTGNYYVLDEILNNGRVSMFFDTGVGVIWPTHGALAAWQALSTCVPSDSK